MSSDFKVNYKESTLERPPNRCSTIPPKLIVALMISEASFAIPNPPSMIGSIVAIDFSKRNVSRSTFMDILLLAGWFLANA